MSSFTSFTDKKMLKNFTLITSNNFTISTFYIFYIYWKRLSFCIINFLYKNFNLFFLTKCFFWFLKLLFLFVHWCFRFSFACLFFFFFFYFILFYFFFFFVLFFKLFIFCLVFFCCSLSLKRHFFSLFVFVSRERNLIFSQLFLSFTFLLLILLLVLKSLWIFASQSSTSLTSEKCNTVFKLMTIYWVKTLSKGINIWFDIWFKKLCFLYIIFLSVTPIINNFIKFIASRSLVLRMIWIKIFFKMGNVT